jgi:hypothetical protein
MNNTYKFDYVYKSGSSLEWPVNKKEIEKRIETGSIEFTPELLESYGYYELNKLMPASHSEEETYDMDTTPHKSGSCYYLGYTVRNKTEEELDMHYKHQWITLRTKRLKLLQETDYMGNSDYPITNEWREYRQALRDITEQDNPFNIVWPNKPE